MQHEPKKIALFVDFDNIYLGLRETSREAAEAFATRPHVWLQWIEQGMPMGEVEPGAPKENRVLIRQCYLNPDTFGKFRGYFTRAGFTVVDCPSLTSRGKNSSDIVMVMDILDALRHDTRFDRFVIMSADADFTPVLQRLRAHDRRTAVMVSGLAAPAYRAACDRLIEEDVFIEHALELPPVPEPLRALTPAAAPPAPSVTAIRDPDLLAAIGRRVYEEASSSGTLPASELPRILREFKEFTPTSNWLGYYSLQALTEAVLEHQPELRITDDDPWRIAVRGADEPAAAPAAAIDAPQPPAADAEPDWEAVRDRVVGLVARMVEESADPVVMGKAAHAAILEVGPRLTETRWLGKGTFKNLLLSARELPFRVVASPLPGYVFDPERHQPPSERASVDGLAELGVEMASLVRRISQLTDAPKLTPRQYRVMWEVIAKELGRAPYNLMGTGKAVRDQCVERGEPIARQAITWVLRGLGYVGYHFEAPAHRPEDLAAAYRGNLLNILRQAQVTLTDDELRMLDDWLLASGADAAPSPAAPAAEARPSAPRPRRVAPADPDAAAEPDYAAWADALLAGASRPAVAPEPDAQPADATRGSAADDRPIPEPEPFEWPPRDALLFEPEARPWLRDDAAASSPDSLFAADTPPDGAIPADAAPAAEPAGAGADAPAPVSASANDGAPDSVSAHDQSATPAPALETGEGRAADAHPAGSTAAPPSDAGSTDAHPALPTPSADSTPAEAGAGDAHSAAPTVSAEPTTPAVDAGDADRPETTADEAAAADANPAEPIVAADPPSSEAGAMDAPPADPAPAADPTTSEAGAADTPADHFPQPPSAMQDDTLTPSDEQPAQPAVEGDAEPGDVVSADWRLSTDAAPSDALPAELAPDATQPDVVPAEWQMAEDAPAPSAETPPASAPSAEPQPVLDAQPAESEGGAEIGRPAIVSKDWEMANDAAPSGPADAHPAVEATRDGDAPPADIVPAEWQMADEPANPATPASTTPTSPGEPSGSEPPHAEQPAADEIVAADWQPAEPTPPTAEADQPNPSAAPPSEPPRAEQPGDGEVVDAAWQPEGEAPAASGAGESAPSADGAATPAAAAEPPPDGIFNATWEPVTQTATAPQPATPSAGATAKDAPAPEPADGVVTPQWEPVTNGARPDGSNASTDAPSEPAAQMDAFPPDAPQGEPNTSERVPAELRPAPDAEPPREEPPQDRQWS